MKQRTITLAITGASGAQYGLRLLQCLLAADCKVYLMISSAAEVVIRTETDLDLPRDIDEQQAFFSTLFDADEDRYWQKMIGLLRSHPAPAHPARW